MLLNPTRALKQALLPSLLAALVALGGMAFMASAAPTAEAQVAVTSLATLQTIAGEDPRADFGRIRIPSIDVDAAIGAHAVPDEGVMPNPYGPGDVSWYDFESTWFGGIPGEGGNAVMSGHVSYNATVSYAGIRYQGAGIFARLDELRPGDTIEVDRGGQTYRYMVSWSRTLPEQTNDEWGRALSSNVSTDSITLYTCDGAFDGGTLAFSHRLVVRAEQVEGTPNAILPAGRITFGISETSHPVALAMAQKYPVSAIYAQHPTTGRWLVYRPGAPGFTNTLSGNLRVGTPVLIVNDAAP